MIENKKCLGVAIWFIATANTIAIGKKMLQPYADKLDWIVEADTENEGGFDLPDGTKAWGVRLVHKKNEMMSFDELIKKIDLLKKISEKVFRELAKNPEIPIITTDIPSNLMEAKTADEVRCDLSHAQVLHVYYNMKDRIELEKENIVMAEKIFGISVREYFDELASFGYEAQEKFKELFSKNIDLE